MARLFAAHIESAATHPFQHVTIANRCPFQRQPLACQISLQSQVRHHCRHHAAAAQLSRSGPAFADECHDLVTINNAALFVDYDQPIRVAIQRNPDIGTAGDNRFLQQSRMG